MRFVTKTRLEYLQSLIRSMGDKRQQSEALHLIESIRRDIEENYAEISSPTRLNDK